MSRPRAELQAIFETVEELAKDNRNRKGLPAVYFQPPPTVRMVYPCIVYSLDQYRGIKADNKNYLIHDRYSVTVVDPNPDSVIPKKLMGMFDQIASDRIFSSDNLQHFTFTLYF